MADSSPEYLRLHISPFNPSLLNVILPPSILPNARNISYHSLETLPSKAYGYVELPVMDADKIKKKLNGSILKGTKVKIETARPQKELVLEPEDPAYPKDDKPLKDSKKRKRGQEAIPAAEIGERTVKRGWTTPTAVISRRDKSKDKDAKPVNKSKYTTGSECLFKTVLPPNVAANVKSKKSEEGKPEKKKRRAEKEVVIHEFTKTTKYATFLRGAASSKKVKGVVEFVEGKGWVDEDRTVVEVLEKKKRPVAQEVVAKPKESTPEDESSEVSSSSEEESEVSDAESTSPPAAAVEEDPTSSSGSSSEDESEASVADISLQPSENPLEASSTSSSGSSEEDSDSSSSEDESDNLSSPAAHSTPKKSTLPQASTSRPQSSSGLSIKIPDSSISSTPIAASVHPLEALYKRPKPGALDPTPKPIVPSFSFFETDANDSDIDMEEARDQVPLTPFTQKDFEFRGIRSAAPTPDTAHANKRFIWPTHNDEDEEGDDMPTSPIRKQSVSKGKEAKGGKSDANEGKGDEAESDFQKWFYENRGETSRAWKKRRKVVGKEKRQRENRKRNDRAF